MNQIIVATHTTLATGFEAFVKFFMPDVANLHIINAYVDTPEFENQLRGVLDTLPAEDGVIVLTDIAGGSVNQKAALLMGEYGFKLVAGINASLLLEIVCRTDPISDEDLAAAVEQARGQMVFMNALALDDIDDSDEL